MKLWIGDHPDPEDRVIIEVSEYDYASVIGAVKPFEIEVRDLLTGNMVTLADADCGLGCRCALRFVEVAQ